MSQWERLVLRALTDGPLTTCAIVAFYGVPARRNVRVVAMVCERLSLEGRIDRLRDGQRGGYVWAHRAAGCESSAA